MTGCRPHHRHRRKGVPVLTERKSWVELVSECVWIAGLTMAVIVGTGLSIEIVRLLTWAAFCIMGEV